MKKYLKIFLIVFVSFIVLIVAAGVILTQISPNHFKGFIAEKVKAQTGRDIHLNGDIRLDFYPWIDLDISDVVLDNPSGFEDLPFFRLSRLKLRLKTLPLLRKQIEMDKLYVRGLQVNLVRNDKGVTNVDDLVRPKGDEKTKSSGKGGLAAFVLGGIDIGEAGLSWKDATNGKQIDITNLTVLTDTVIPGKPVDLKVSLDAVSSVPDMSGSLDLKTTVRYDIDNKRYGLDPLTVDTQLAGAKLPGKKASARLAARIDADMAKDTVEIADIEFEGLDTAVKGNVRLENAGTGRPLVSSTLDISGKDMAELFRIFEIEPLAGELARLKNRSFKIAGEFTADMNSDRAGIKNLAGEILGSQFQGSFDAGGLQTGKPSVKGRIAAEGPDFPALVLVAGQLTGNQNIKGAGNRLSKSGTKQFAITGRFDADLSKGNIEVPSLGVNLPGLTLSAEVSGQDVQSDAPVVKGFVEAKGEDLPLWLELAGYFETNPDKPLGTYGKKLAVIKDKGFKFNLDFAMDMKTGRVQVPGLKAASLGVNVVGSLEGEKIDQPDGRMNGNLSLNAENLSPLLNALGQKDAAKSLKSLSLSAGLSGNLSRMALQPFDLTAGVSAGKKAKKPEMIRLKADTLINMKEETLQVEPFTLTGAGLDVKGKVRAGQFKTALTYGGSVRVAPFNAKKLLARLNQVVPKTQSKQALTRVGLSGDFTGSSDDINLKQIHLQLDDTKIDGSIAAGQFKKPQINFDLRIDKLNVDHYLPPADKSGKARLSGKKQKAAEGKKGGGKTAPDPISSQALPLAPLKLFDADGQMYIGDLTLAKARMSDVEFKLAAKDGNARIAPFWAKLYEGAVDADVQVDASRDVPGLKIESKMTGIQAEPLLNDVTGQARLRGKGDFTASLTSKGVTVDEIKAGLNGNMNFKFADGALIGFNIGKLLRQLKSMRSNLAYNASDTEETDFTMITGNPVAKNGVVRLDDLNGMSPGFRIHGKGVVAHLPKERIDYIASVTVVETSKGQGGQGLSDLKGITIPVRIRGPLKEPKIEPDIEEAVKSLATEELQQQINKGVQNIFNKLFE